MNGSTIPERNSSLNLSMKISYHGREQTSADTARMNSALLRLCNVAMGESSRALVTDRRALLPTAI